jgi:hypothetical protein
VPYDPNYDYGDGYSAQVARENTAKEMAARADKQAEREAAYLKRFQAGTRDAMPARSVATGPATESSKTLVEQAAMGPTQLDRARDKRAAKRAAARAEAEKPPADTRTSAQKLADRFGIGR